MVMTDSNARATVSPSDTPKPQDDPPIPASGEGESVTKRPDPTRYGDWEKNGRCIDF